MNQHLQNILNSIQQDKNLSEEEKNTIIKSLKDADKEFEITNFKLDRTEKVKRTTAILLEETIEELEQKRKAVEAQNRELAIESSLERIRTVAMGMMKADDLLKICEVQFTELKQLGFSEIRNGLIGIYHDNKNYFTDYDYSDFSGGNIHQIPYNKNSVVDQGLKRMKSANDAFTEFFVEGEELEEWKAFRMQNGEYDDTRIKDVSRLYYYFYSISQGNIGISTFSKISDDQLIILKRFRNVFDLAYKRYVDITNAEAQAREAQIEAALEKVRGRAMAMHNSNDVTSTASTVFSELRKLGIHPIRSGVGLLTNDLNKVLLYAATSSIDTDDLSLAGEMDMSLDPYLQQQYKSCLEKENYFLELSGAELKSYYMNLSAQIPVPPLTSEQLSHKQYGYYLPFSSGYFYAWTQQPYSENEINILNRFKAIFDLTFRRYLDLQKAEAQSREAHIQLALERVRARTMAMQKSDELGETAYVLFQQFEKLGEDPEQIGIGIMNEDEAVMELWSTINGKLRDHVFKVSLDEPVLIRKLYAAYKEEKKTFTVDITGKDLEDYNNFRKSITDVKLDVSRTKDRRVVSVAYFSKGLISLATPEPRPAETMQLLERFAGVFDLTYTRFLDLQKAEAQAREAQIEVSLERVRSKAMSMHKSEDLQTAVAVVFEELEKLQLGVLRCGISVLNKEKRCGNVWLTSTDQDKVVQVTGDEPFDIHPLLQGAFEAWLKQEDFYYVLEGDDLVKYYKAVKNAEFMLPESQMLVSETNRKQYCFVAVYNSGGLFAFQETAFTEEAKKIMRRFAAVFDLTYKRFLDLQKAEAQAREAKIEAALERVRSRTMAMHKSEDLHEVIKVVTEQLLGLDIKFNVANFAKVYTEGSWDLWVSTPEQAYPAFIHVPYLDHKIFNNVLEKIKKGVDTFTDVYEQEEKNIFFRHFFENTVAKYTPEERKQYVYGTNGFSRSLIATKNIWFSVCLYDTTPFSDEEKAIFKRFANVFEQAYTRFLDLQKAEAQAREATIESALEKVRSRTLAMQKSDELAETAAVVFRQLINLGIEPNRLYIAIINDKKGNTEFWITDEDGTKVSSAFHTNLNDNPTFKKMLEGWATEKKSLVIDMHGEELQEYFKYLSSIHVPFKGGLEQTKRMQHIAYFAKGFIGIASSDDQPDETMLLLEKFAAVFNLTFTRFNDLKIAEAHAIQAELDLIAIKEAKQKAEETLNELQATQTQLIQSEKMASLGELTAGIAHEIQNPLNFVNNFSEVSVELIKEMIDEVNKGNTDEAKEIAHDLVQNLEKITHHGKRADAIVKGMLQHSRTTSATKEPTDINKLADEYLRLAYHGLRAKEKSFNATLKTDFDQSIGKISIIPQDIGRVILNLITNAFYAVGEKKKVPTGFENLSGLASYEPTVSVSTKKIKDKAEIKVADNGNGVPKNIIDKIFQPFFTTKPTGQGTGLGLSLSYDIVKAHGGELKIKTKENEGSEFTIQLPITD